MQNDMRTSSADREGSFVEQYGLELLYRTEEVLVGLGVPFVAASMLQALGEQTDVGRHLSRLGELMGELEAGFAVTVPPAILHGSFLLLVHNYLRIGLMTGSFTPDRSAEDLMLANSLFLHRPQTWAAADKLAPLLFDGNDVVQVKRSLQLLASRLAPRE